MTEADTTKSKIIASVQRSMAFNLPMRPAGAVKAGGVVDEVAGAGNLMSSSSTGSVRAFLRAAFNCLANTCLALPTRTGSSAAATLADASALAA